MHLLLLILLILNPAGLVAFITGLAILIGSIVGVVYVAEISRIWVSSPMSLQVHQQSGYKVFDVTKDQDFNSYPFKKTISDEPFVLKGGIPTTYVIRSPRIEETGDKRISKVTFHESTHQAYMSAKCIHSLVDFDQMRSLQVSKLEEQFKTGACEKFNCSMLIKDFKQTDYADFSCNQMITEKLDQDASCSVDAFGNAKGINEQRLVVPVCKSKQFIYTQTWSGYQRRIELERLYLQSL